MHDDETRRADGTLADREKRTHAELLHVLLGQHFDRNTELAERNRMFRELKGAKNVCRFVDEIAGQQNALTDRLCSGKRLFGVGRGGRDNGHLDLGRISTFILALLRRDLVAIEHIGAQAKAENELRKHGGIGCRFGHVEENGHIRSLAERGCRSTAGIEPVVFRQTCRFTHTEHDQLVGRRTVRGKDRAGGQPRSLEISRLLGACQHVSGCDFRRAGS